MKGKILKILAIALALLGAITISNQVMAADDVIEIQDKDLKEKLSLYDTNSDGQIQQSEMKKVEELENVKITDLSPLKYAVNLKKLIIYDSNITDITPLKYTVNLRKLSIRNSNITDITPLENLTQLEELDLTLNKNITDITPLKNLTRLRVLLLRSNQITNIQSLQNLTGIEQIDLSDNKIIDITPLKKLISIQRLNLCDNKIIDISALDSMYNLKTLMISNNQITNITALKNLSNNSFTSIYLDNNNIKDITPLQNITDILWLYLQNNQITNIEPLRNMTKLLELSLSNNKIENIKALRNMKSLERLALSNNNIRDISPLLDLPKLKKVELINNPINDKEKNNADTILMFKVRPIEYTISEYRAKKIKNCTISNIANQNYTGKAVKPSITIKNGRTTLRNGTDYIVSYKNNTNLGTATVTITGKGNYIGTITKTFKIVVGQVKNVVAKSQDTKSITVKWSKPSGSITGYEVYMATSKNGKYKKIATITKNSTTTYKKTKLSSGKNYYFKVRAYKTIKSKKNYGAYSAVLETATKTKTPSISKVTAGKKKVAIKWKKVSGATGYEVYMATSKKGKYTKIATNTKNSKVSYTKTKLKSKKKYYFKIRTYKTVTGKKIYSSYSSIKNVKVK